MIDNRGEFCWPPSWDAEGRSIFVLKQESFGPSETSILPVERARVSFIADRTDEPCRIEDWLHPS